MVLLFMAELARGTQLSCAILITKICYILTKATTTCSPTHTLLYNGSLTITLCTHTYTNDIAYASTDFCCISQVCASM